MAVVFENEGLANLRALTTFGVSAKRDKTAIGFFGTGFKMAVGIVLRNRGQITLWRGCRRHEFGTQIRRIRGQTVRMVTLNGEELGFTTDVGKNWEAWQAYRELAVNARDEYGSVWQTDERVRGVKNTTQVVVDWREMELAHENRASVFLESDLLFRLNGVDVHEGESQYIYYQGLRVYELSRRSMYTYNLTDWTHLTEDRTLRYPTLLPGEICSAVVSSDRYELIQKCLRAGEEYFESSLDYTDVPHGDAGDSFLRAMMDMKARDEKLPETARKLFTEAASKRVDVYDNIAKRPTEFETEIIREAERMLLQRCPNLVFPEAFVLDESDSVDIVSPHRMNVGSECLTRGPQHLAKKILVEMSSFYSEKERATEWLADIIITRSAHQGSRSEAA